MEDELLLAPRRATADRPLLGQTILMVEDSRFAGETVRLICLKGGARIRRASTLRAAERHLKSYRPSVVIVDLGLPDGSGLGLIRDVAQSQPRPAIVAISGDPDLADASVAAGADSFLPKPFGSVAMFQSAILSLLPAELRPLGPRIVDDAPPAVDPEALRDDLALISDLLDSQSDRATIVYALSFARGVARSMNDASLLGRVTEFERAIDRGRSHAAEHSALAALVQDRLTGRRIAV